MYKCRIYSQIEY